MTFYSDRERYYLQYLSDNKVRDPQTPAMAMGSAVDARIKAYLYPRYVGDGDPAFEFDTLFASQVEPHNRDELLAKSKIVFKAYVESGALRRLCDILDRSTNVRMEYRLEGDLFGVPFCGYPDLSCDLDGEPVIFDYKVNGYYSKAGIGPKKYYSWIEAGFNETGKPIRGNKQAHKDALIRHQSGVEYCANHGFEEIDEKWAFQMMSYHFMNGVPYDQRPLIAIEQFSCQPNKIRIASLRGMVSAAFVAEMERKIKHVHSVVTNVVDGYPHIFDNIPKDENDAKCQLMDGFAAIPNETPMDKFMNSYEKKRFGF